MTMKSLASAIRIKSPPAQTGQASVCNKAKGQIQDGNASISGEYRASLRRTDVFPQYFHYSMNIYFARLKASTFVLGILVNDTAVLL